jgi:hypothetical protein
MPWDQIVTATAVLALAMGGWIYAWRPERPPRRRTAPHAVRTAPPRGLDGAPHGAVHAARPTGPQVAPPARGPQVPLGR